MRDQGVSGDHAEQCGTYRRCVCQYQCNGKHAGSTLAKSGNGWCDETDYDQRYAESDHLTKQMLDGNNNVHKRFVGNEPDCDSDDNSGQ